MELGKVEVELLWKSLEQVKEVEHPDVILVQLDNHPSVSCDAQSSGWVRAFGLT